MTPSLPKKLFQQLTCMGVLTNPQTSPCFLPTNRAGMPSKDSGTKPQSKEHIKSTVPCSKQQVVTVTSSLLKHTVQTRPEKDLSFKDNSKLPIFGWLCHRWKENTNIVEFPATRLHPEGCSPAHLPHRQLMDGACGRCFSCCPAQPCLDPFPPTPWPGCWEATHHHHTLACPVPGNTFSPSNDKKETPQSQHFLTENSSVGKIPTRSRCKTNYGRLRSTSNLIINLCSPEKKARCYPA